MIQWRWKGAQKKLVPSKGAQNFIPLIQFLEEALGASCECTCSAYDVGPVQAVKYSPNQPALIGCFGFVGYSEMSCLSREAGCNHLASKLAPCPEAQWGPSLFLFCGLGRLVVLLYVRVR